MKYSFGSAGAGTQAHLAGEQFRSRRCRESTKILAQPDKSHADQFRLATGGHAARPGALAVTSKTRSQIFPDVPTMTEAGYPQIEGDSWVGILVPAGTPAEIIAVLY